MLDGFCTEKWVSYQNIGGTWYEFSTEGGEHFGSQSTRRCEDQELAEIMGKHGAARGVPV